MRIEQYHNIAASRFRPRQTAEGLYAALSRGMFCEFLHHRTAGPRRLRHCLKPNRLASRLPWSRSAKVLLAPPDPLLAGPSFARVAAMAIR
jgi:hypothetical protein